MHNIRLTQIDGKLPNLALMRLSHYFKSQGSHVHFTRDVTRGLFEPSRYEHVFGSAIFSNSENRIARLKKNFPDAVIGGTGSGDFVTLESVCPGIGPEQDYSLYPDFSYSIGFLTRGCRLKCGFCVVPKKEGKPIHNVTVGQLWRGNPHPKKLHLLDNDFFGAPDWQRHVDDIRSGGFRVCFNQGINIRMITEESAAALASIEYRDDQFKCRRLYTAWDNLGDEQRFFKGVDLLESAGVPPKHLMVYMLVGYAKNESWKDIFHRFNRMVERGILPYPMVYDAGNRPLRAFQRWVIRGLYRYVPWNEYTRRVHD